MRRTLVLAITALFVSGCTAPPTAAPTAQPTAAAAVAKAGAAAVAAKPPPQNWAEVFPAGAGKEPTLQVCGTCHGLDRLVLGQKAPDRWESVKNSHSDKAGGLSDQQLTVVFTYLADQFGPDDPEPNITGLPTTGVSAE